MAKPLRKFTYQDYRNLPESDIRYEVIDGELLVVPSPRFTHQEISRRLEIILSLWVDERGLGAIAHAPLDVVLGDDVVQPDILFVSKERLGIIEEEAVFGSPDLAVEILSPTTASRDLTQKRALYARHGVKEYWIVDPDAAAVKVLRRGAGGFEKSQILGRRERLTTPLLPELEIDLSRIFP